MKRGLITWDKSELPPAAFESRAEAVRKALAARDLPAMVVFTDIWRSNQGRHFSNFMPYWNRALIVLPRDGAPVLLCGLSPRVYPWIRSVTILDEIRPSGNLPQKLFELCAERDWKRIGVLDLSRLPGELSIPVRAGSVEMVEIPAGEVWPAADEWEVSMHQRAVLLARRILDEELPGALGVSDHEFTGRLERAFRRAGAEDLVILTTEGSAAPHPPDGATIGADSSVTVAVEYRGHWVKVSRPHPSSSVAGPLRKLYERAVKTPPAKWNQPAYLETLSGPYPYESSEPGEIQRGTLFALHVEMESNGRRLFYGDTARQGPQGAELL